MTMMTMMTMTDPEAPGAIPAAGDIGITSAFGWASKRKAEVTPVFPVVVASSGLMATFHVLAQTFDGTP